MATNIIPETIYKYYKKSIKDFSNNISYGIINGESLTFTQLGERVERIAQLLNKYGVQTGEKVAILGGSMPNWPASYLAISTTSRIVIPLLPDFSAFEISNILEHSQTRYLIISKKLIYKLSDSVRDQLDLIICLENLEELKIPQDNQGIIGDNKITKPEYVEPTIPRSSDIASIIYTSGTSGASKGVMLTHGNITSNLQQCYQLFPISSKDIFLSFLPLSHAYECTLGMLYPMKEGASVYYLDGAPTPTLLMPALKKVRPTCICSVPLIVEKIFKNKVRPMFTKNWIMQVLYSIIPIRRMLHKAAGKKMLEMFGGRLRFFGVGGSKLDGMVEQFLRDAGFPYAIGYGLTECAPLIAGQVNDLVFQSTGPKLYGLEMKINNPNQDGIGEIIVRGPNIMLGYYNDIEKTKAAFLPDNWFRTKDLGKFDKKGNLFIKGRVDNMLIGANGENIYPEEIESVINDNDFVLESLVTKVGDKLVAKVYFNYEQIAALIDFKEVDAEIRKNISEKYEQVTAKYEQLVIKYEKWREEKGYKIKNPKVKKEKETKIREEVIVSFQEKLDKIQKELLSYINDRVNKTSKISEIIEQQVPFEKTATQKIKRYLYT